MELSATSMGLPRSAILEPDVIVPAQWADGPEAEENGERRLYQGIVLDAIHCLIRARDHKGPEPEETTLEILSWIKNLDDPAYVVPFRTAIARGYPTLDADTMASVLIRDYERLQFRERGHFVVRPRRGVS